MRHMAITGKHHGSGQRCLFKAMMIFVFVRKVRREALLTMGSIHLKRWLWIRLRNRVFW